MFTISTLPTLPALPPPPPPPLILVDPASQLSCLQDQVSRAFKLQRMENVMSRITEFLFLSGAGPATNSSALAANKISTIINCACTVVPSPFSSEINYKNFALLDAPGQQLCAVFTIARQIIDSERSKGRRTLVHCHQGVSRSGAVVVSYMMASCGLSLNDALAVTRTQRCIVQPNPGFLCELRKWEQMLEIERRSGPATYRMAPIGTLMPGEFGPALMPNQFTLDCDTRTVVVRLEPGRLRVGVGPKVHRSVLQPMLRAAKTFCEYLVKYVGGQGQEQGWYVSSECPTEGEGGEWREIHDIDVEIDMYLSKQEQIMTKEISLPVHVPVPALKTADSFVNDTSESETETETESGSSSDYYEEPEKPTFSLPLSLPPMLPTSLSKHQETIDTPSSLLTTSSHLSLSPPSFAGSVQPTLSPHSDFNSDSDQTSSDEVELISVYTFNEDSFVKTDQFFDSDDLLPDSIVRFEFSNLTILWIGDDVEDDLISLSMKLLPQTPQKLSPAAPRPTSGSWFIVGHEPDWLVDIIDA